MKTFGNILFQGFNSYGFTESMMSLDQFLKNKTKCVLYSCLRLNSPASAEKFAFCFNVADGARTKKTNATC